MCRGSKLGREWMGGALKILRVPNIHIGRWALGVCSGWVVGGPWECVGGWVGCALIRFRGTYLSLSRQSPRPQT